jgi:hypothetical protein
MNCHSRAKQGLSVLDNTANVDVVEFPRLEPQPLPPLSISDARARDPIGKEFIRSSSRMYNHLFIQFLQQP